MTLRFNKDSIVDTRQVEYEKSIVLLGLAKAKIERSVGEEKQRLSEVEERRGEVQAELGQKILDVAAEENKLANIREEISAAIKKSSSDISSLQERGQEKEVMLGKQKDGLSELQKHFDALGIEIENRNTNIKDLQAKEGEVRETLAAVQSELMETAREKKKELAELTTIQSAASNLSASVVQKKEELAELEEIISVLRESNKDGLDLVASFDGERTRLKEKDEFLCRKEADLAIYEKRLKKRMEEVGYNPSMVFI